MALPIDERIARQIRALYDQAGLHIDVEVNDGVARLTGLVASPEIHQAALDLARMVEGVIEIVDELDYEVIAPDSVFESPDVDREFGYADAGAFADDIPDTEPDFVVDEGDSAADYERSIEQGEPYFPPTDPVCRPSPNAPDLVIIGGFQDTSMDELATQANVEPGQEPSEIDLYRRRNDEDIREDVLRELREDALTSDLTLRVDVVDGVVCLHGAAPSIDDSVNAEAVASRVPGVVEVRNAIRIDP